MRLLERIKEWWRGRQRDARVPDEDPAEEETVDPFNPFPDPVEIEIRDVFDLHSIPPRDVARIVAEYLKEAYRKGFPSVRIIHGKGIGVQREIVRSILERSSLVDRWTDAPPEAGGRGATVVHFSRKQSAG